MSEIPVHPFTDVTLLTREQVLASPCPIPAVAGVYGWTLLYVGISPKAPPRNGRRPSRQTVRSRVRYHYRGNAEGSTLRLTLGVLLADRLGLELRRVGSGTRRTFSAGEERLSDWMAEHARVTVREHPEPWVLEEELIGALDLPLNLDQNSGHGFHAELSSKRRRAKLAALALPVLPR
jgi:hypothetical protein